METLNTLLIVSLISFGVGVVTTAALVLLVAIYNNLKAVSNKMKEEEDSQDNTWAIPLSALSGGMGGSPYHMSDQQKAAAMAAIATASKKPEETKKASEGMYL